MENLSQPTAEPSLTVLLGGIVNDAKELLVQEVALTKLKVRDEELERTVKKAFDTPDLKDISIEAKNGVVRLTGPIPTGTRRLMNFDKQVR
jgi:hypothetical protein